MKVKTGFMLREVAKNYIVVPVGKAGVDFNGIITLNETGAFLWEKLESDISIEQLIIELTNTYNVDNDTAKMDIDNFLKTLNQNHLIE